MSREPSSPMMRGWDAYKEEPEPPPTRDVLRKPQPPSRRRRRRAEATAEQREKVFAKYATSTEKLTAEERQIIRGYRISRRDLGMED